jgi:hypothetical protein
MIFGVCCGCWQPAIPRTSNPRARTEDRGRRAEDGVFGIQFIASVRKVNKFILRLI